MHLAGSLVRFPWLPRLDTWPFRFVSSRQVEMATSIRDMFMKGSEIIDYFDAQSGYVREAKAGRCYLCCCPSKTRKYSKLD